MDERLNNVTQGCAQAILARPFAIACMSVLVAYAIADVILLNRWVRIWTGAEGYWRYSVPCAAVIAGALGWQLGRWRVRDTGVARALLLGAVVGYGAGFVGHAVWVLGMFGGLQRLLSPFAQGGVVSGLASLTRPPIVLLSWLFGALAHGLALYFRNTLNGRTLLVCTIALFAWLVARVAGLRLLQLGS